MLQAIQPNPISRSIMHLHLTPDVIHPYYKEKKNLLKEFNRMNSNFETKRLINREVNNVHFGHDTTKWL